MDVGETTGFILFATPVCRVQALACCIYNAKTGYTG